MTANHNGCKSQRLRQITITATNHNDCNSQQLCKEGGRQSNTEKNKTIETNTIQTTDGCNQKEEKKTPTRRKKRAVIPSPSERFLPKSATSCHYFFMVQTPLPIPPPLPLPLLHYGIAQDMRSVPTSIGVSPIHQAQLSHVTARIR